MILRQILPIRIAMVITILVFPAAVLANADSALHEAYYTEKAAKDFSAAKKLYDKALKSGVQGADKAEALAGSARCRDRLAAEDFASIMPDDAVAYVEVRRPGALLGKLADMLGLRGKSIPDALSERPSTRSGALFHIPKQIVISPHIFEFFEGFGGAAVAITEIHEDGPPEGVLAFHHGDTDLFRGVLETAFQFSPLAEKIRDLPTFSISYEGVSATGVLTESLFIVGSSRELVEGAAGRLLGSGTSSLGSREDLAGLADRRSGATLFAYVDLQRAIEFAKKHSDDGDENDITIANALFDLDSLRWAAFSFGIDDGTLSAEWTVRLADDHRNLVYNLTRFPPMSKQCLSKVPADAAGFLGIGLNPALSGVLSDAAERNAVSGLDIGREFFSNIRELCFFVTSDGPGGTSSRPLPNVGLLMAVNDSAKSMALWDQFLTLPGLFVGPEPVAPRSTKISGADVTVYKLPEVGSIYMTELGDCVAIGLTRDALKSAIRAHTKEQSILNDPVMADAIENAPKDSSLLVVAHVGRLMKVAAGFKAKEGASQEEVMAMGMGAQLCSEMIAWVGVGQSHNEMSIQTAVRGLPKVNKALKVFGPLLNGLLGTAMQQQTIRMDQESGNAAGEELEAAMARRSAQQDEIE
ncbi:MAG: hypothetical protein O7D94_00795 [Planctomycetota bacterium]|nr:hypothetical protein [Planctomycetota bacterium]